MDADNYVPTYCGPSYTDLPMEIILQILEYLKPPDLYVASLTCRRWFEASHHSNFTAQMAVNFTKVHFADHTSPASEFLNSLRNYPKIILNHVEFGSTDEFWDRFGDNVEQLSFLNCDLREKYLNVILKKVKNLTSLEIENCRELFMSGRLFDKDKDKHAICHACRNVTSLSLTFNRYLSDALFHRFVTIMPKLKSMNLSGCHISFHRGLYKKFIECEAKSLKNLNFSSTLIDGAALTALAEISDLKLEVLRLQSCDQLTNTGIISLVQKQPSLMELDLTSCVRLTDAGLMEICSSLASLRVLKLRRCRAITDMGVKEIVNLRNLKILDISECEAVTSRSIIDGIAKILNSTMTELYVSALNICEMSIIQIAENMPNLRVLDLSYCKNGVTNLAVQLIFKHLVWLRTLNLDYCDKRSSTTTTHKTNSRTMIKDEPFGSEAVKDAETAETMDEISGLNVGQARRSKNVNTDRIARFVENVMIQLRGLNDQELEEVEREVVKYFASKNIKF